MSKTFTLTEEHVLLLKRMYVGWQDCEYGAPEIDPKRPYGNSDVEGDIGEILGFKVDHEEDWDDPGSERAAKLHKETQIALQIVLFNLDSSVVGTYTPSRYGAEWTRVEDADA